MRILDPVPPEALYGRDEEPIPFRGIFAHYLDDGAVSWATPTWSSG